MGLSEAVEAIELCEAHEGADFVGRRSAALVSAAEAALGLRFPPSYRLFIQRLGAGSIGSFEVYGVISQPFDGPIPDAVWVTLDSRRGPSSLPPTMVVIGDDGMGGEYVLDTHKDDEPPVEVWYGGASHSGDELEDLAPDFGTFLLEGVRREISRP